MKFSIPSRGFWFFEEMSLFLIMLSRYSRFQSPRGDFGFLKGILVFEDDIAPPDKVFNPLAGILVF